MEERIGLSQKPIDSVTQLSLNPYCNGRKNRMAPVIPTNLHIYGVLILIVMEERIGWELKPAGYVPVGAS